MENNQKPDIAMMMAARSTPLALVDVTGGEIKPHPESGNFMHELQQFATQVATSSYAGMAWGAIAGGKIGKGIGMLALNPITMGFGAAVGVLMGGAGGLAVGGVVGAAKGVTRLFSEDKQDIVLKDRIMRTNLSIGNAVSDKAKPMTAKELDEAVETRKAVIERAKNISHIRDAKEEMILVRAENIHNIRKNKNKLNS